ncbi:unnamed protein product [Pieris brassicae]|uniref:Nucleolar protein 16 n=1 Tax=Pieris brassicae TaxID=7116 RepID=A0A9P0XK56_PIEBR|nr:unnamed protein product [Pieris brassicae]
MKIKKQHRKKKYLHKLNRKRMHLRQKSTGTVNCKALKEAWNNNRSTFRNLRDMGLVNDPNKAIKIPSYKEEQLKIAKKIVDPDELESEEPKVVKSKPRKMAVVEKLEQEAHAPRERRFKLPKGQVEFITYLLDKYGHDYKAMAKDKKNYYQETWKQLRAKIKTFMGIPKQYGEYLKARGLLDKEENEDELKEQAKALIMDDSD